MAGRWIPSSSKKKNRNSVSMSRKCTSNKTYIYNNPRNMILCYTAYSTEGYWTKREDSNEGKITNLHRIESFFNPSSMYIFIYIWMCWQRYIYTYVDREYVQWWLKNEKRRRFVRIRYRTKRVLQMRNDWKSVDKFVNTTIGKGSLSIEERKSKEKWEPRQKSVQ